jgi:hypothetical protein
VSAGSIWVKANIHSPTLVDLHGHSVKDLHYVQLGKLERARRYLSLKNTDQFFKARITFGYFGESLLDAENAVEEMNAEFSQSPLVITALGLTLTKYRQSGDSQEDRWPDVHFPFQD